MRWLRRARRPAALPAALLAVLLPLAAGCGARADDGARITVFAASSLTEVFSALGEAFERRHPGTAVSFSFGSSATLAQQIVRGAPADVFAAASPQTMATVTGAGLAPEDPPVIARNRLQIAVPPDNPGRVRGLADLARPEVTVALCAERVPCGEAARRMLREAGVQVWPDSYERDVKAALTKVLLGEVDAALVYRTDVRAAAPKVRGIDVPEAARAVTAYPIVVLDRAPRPEAARAFVAYVRSEAGRRALIRAGFEAP